MLDVLTQHPFQVAQLFRAPGPMDESPLADADRAQPAAPGRHQTPPLSGQNTPAVFVVDSDCSARLSLEALLRAAGWHVEGFDSVEAFLRRPSIHSPSCIVLEVANAGSNGLETLQRLASERNGIPVIVTAVRADVQLGVRAMKMGALDFLLQPLEASVLLGTVESAIQRSSARLQVDYQDTVLRRRHASLSRREREVMKLVVAGLMNKQVGDRLGISEITVKAHRGKVMRKMETESLAGLVTIANKLGLAPTYGGSVVCFDHRRLHCGQGMLA